VRTARTGALGGSLVATYGLIAANVIVFLVEIGTAGNSTGFGSSFTNKLLLYGPKVADGEVWRIVTSGFLHYGFLHILFNMYALYILGGLLEPRIGRVRFLLLYFVSLLSGSFGALVISPNDLTAGASGAIFGLLAAGIIFARTQGAGYIANQLWLWVGISVLFTVANRGQISVGGHIGGFIGGGLAALVLFEVPRRIRAFPAAAAPLLVAGVGAAAVAGSLAVA
jgi:membrane associated rhomboid family serine protease